ncbi:MAG: hypothetical protein ACYDCM_11335 [Candidatus Acidiferrales bacterium]
MSRLMRFLLLQFFIISGFGLAVGNAQSGGISSQPAAVVQSLYRQVIAHHPLGIPSGENWKVFAPYLSRGLIRRITLARSCQNDWVRQNQGKMIKEPFAWGETGFFSGAEELSEPSSFHVERTEANHDGSFRVYVKLTESPPNHTAWSWDVAVRVKIEERRPVIDDVVYLKGDDVPTEYRLSEILTEGCHGSHWVGDKK